MINLNINGGKNTGSVSFWSGMTVLAAITEYDEHRIVIPKGKITGITIGGQGVSENTALHEGDVIEITLEK
jgi:hypothetical protein